MFRKRTQRVVFASGVLFVLSLAIFGSLVAVAWMSMNNTIAVSADSFTAEDEFAIASRLGNDAPVLHSRIGNDVPVLHSRIGNDVPVLHSRLGNEVPVLHRLLDPGMFRSVDYKQYVQSMGYKTAASESGSSSSGRISDYSYVWQMIRTTH